MLRAVGMAGDARPSPDARTRLLVGLRPLPIEFRVSREKFCAEVTPEVSQASPVVTDQSALAQHVLMSFVVVPGRWRVSAQPDEAARPHGGSLDGFTIETNVIDIADQEFAVPGPKQVDARPLLPIEDTNEDCSLGKQILLIKRDENDYRGIDDAESRAEPQINPGSMHPFWFFIERKGRFHLSIFTL